jgi:glycine/D-amino acid oxidase-like deaminating enzyme
MKRSYDAIIIGAGVVGLSAAYQLSSRGLDIIVIEKDFPVAGSTNRCIGGIRRQFSTVASNKFHRGAIHWGEFKLDRQSTKEELLK